MNAPCLDFLGCEQHRLASGRHFAQKFSIKAWRKEQETPSEGCVYTTLPSINLPREHRHVGHVAAAV